MRPLLDASAYLTNPAKLRAQAESEGYLYLPGLLPRDKVMEVRDAFAGILGTAGWLEEGQGRALGCLRLSLSRRAWRFSTNSSRCWGYTSFNIILVCSR